jgi:hypothetical protein
MVSLHFVPFYLFIALPHLSLSLSLSLSLFLSLSLSLLAVLDFELRGLELAKQVLYSLSQSTISKY